MNSLQNSGIDAMVGRFAGSARQMEYRGVQIDFTVPILKNLNARSMHVLLIQLAYSLHTYRQCKALLTMAWTY